MSYIPPMLAAEVAPFGERYFTAMKMRGIVRERAWALFRLIPMDIRRTLCFLDKLTQIWRYEYGDPIDRMPDDRILIGTEMFQPVDRICEVLLDAERRLSPDDFVRFLARLSNRRKHNDVLAEFAPLLRLSPEVVGHFEVNGYGPGSHTIDWLLQFADGAQVLLEVKSRITDLVQHFEQIARGERAHDGSAPAPRHSVALLFRSLDKKFIERSPSDMLQGAWVYTRMKQDEAELWSSFNALNPNKIHFVMLGDWNPDAYVLTRGDVDAETIHRLFCTVPSSRQVFQREQ